MKMYVPGTVTGTAKPGFGVHLPRSILPSYESIERGKKCEWREMYIDS